MKDILQGLISKILFLIYVYKRYYLIGKTHKLKLTSSASRGNMSYKVTFIRDYVMKFVRYAYDMLDCININRQQFHWMRNTKHSVVILIINLVPRISSMIKSGICQRFWANNQWSGTEAICDEGRVLFECADYPQLYG